LIPLALGLAGSEAALGAVPLWCALAFAREPTWRGRLRECLPALALGVAYLTAYSVLGGGTRGSGGYHDPLANPLAFAELAAVRLPILLGDAALAIPAELAFVASHAALALAGLAATGVVALAYRATRPHPAGLGWLALAGVVALLPGVAGYPTGRVLLVPDLAFAAILGSILARGMAAPRPGMLLALLLAVAHLLWSPLCELHDQHALGRRGRFTERVAREVRGLVPPGGRAILVAASDPFVFLYPHAVLAGTARGAVTCWSVLSAARGRHRLTRTGEHELTLEPLDHPLLAGSFDVLFRAPDRAFIAGDTVEQCGATIRVTEVQHGLPSRLAITYQRRLDDPKLTFLVWRDRHLARLALPAIGESVELPGQ
jgi:hypothetical protein